MRYAGGELIKFLDHDDLLHPDCLEKMVAALDRHPSASFVFSRRKILVDDPHDPGVRFWLMHNEELQRHFGELAEVNDGAAMLRAWVDEGMASNWIAEPAGVMTRRSCIDRIGGRSRRVRFITDMEFWGRMMTCGDVVFLDEALYTYRFALTGLTGAAVGSDRHWLDPLWGAVGILPLTRGEAERATVRRMRYLLARRAWRRALTHLVRAKPGAVRKIGDLLVYTGFRARAMVGLAPPLYPEVRFTPHSSPE